MNKDSLQLVMAQMEEVQAKHQALELVQDAGGQMRVQGSIGFTIEHNGRTITDTYQIELHIPDDYPASPPSAYEPGGKVPENFHKYLKSLELCLGTWVEVRMRFAKHRSLLTFIDEQVISSYLFAYSFKRDVGYLPNGDLDHGAAGILQYYQDYFGVDTLVATKLLKLLADDAFPPASHCPCKSGRKLAECHGPRLETLRPHYWPELFNAELQGIRKLKEVTEALEHERERLRKTRVRNKQRRARKQARKGRRR